MSNVEMDPSKFRSTMSSLNYGSVMEAAARNLQKELLAEQRATAAGTSQKEEFDLEQLEDDDELEQLQRDRMAQLKREVEKRAALHSKGHGEYRDISQDDFLPEVTGSALVLVHFYHQDFERCRIVDKHLGPLAKKYFGTKFVRIHAPDAPFFVTKLKVKTLPCVVFFRGGVAYDRIVGFEEFGARDDFSTALLEKRLLGAGVVRPEKGEDGEEEEAEEAEQRTRVRHGGPPPIARGDGDESSDFDD